MDTVEADIAKLPMSIIIPHLAGTLSLTNEDRAKKGLLLNRVMREAPQQIIDHLRNLGVEHEREKLQRRGKKRLRPPEPDHPRKAARTEIHEGVPGMAGDGGVKHTSSFLQLPSTEEVQEIYKTFYSATGTEALRSTTCGVCARESSMDDRGIQRMKLTDIPNPTRLRPKKPHAMHALVNDMLLEPTAIHEDGVCTTVAICRHCLAELRKPGDSPPRYSLANQLWIGECPWVLQRLTFPEQMLIALLYPRVYVFKLFPKRNGGVRDVSSLQNAMRGNVCTFDHNIEAISSMVEGNLMPRPPAILASLISVTFVGVGNLPRNWIRSTFRVRRQAIREALQWLKKNNPKYYGGIQISCERLDSLPEDDVPVEISSVIRQSEDVGIVEQESEGYVPQDDDEVREPSAERSVSNTDRADVVPLQVSGTIDTEMATITAREMMAWGLNNLWEEGKEGAYAVRHGNQPVSDFGRPLRNTANGEDEVDTKYSNFFEKAYPCLYPYGEGGIEGQQEVRVDFVEHVRWSLQYHDRRFRKHETFPFVAFGILQRRQALGSARVQMERKTFRRDARTLSTITVEKMQRAQEEEEKNIPISDPAIRLLRQHLYSTAGRVVGTDQSRTQLRSQIWATSIMFNPPSLWITVNPCDLHDPIAQVFAGADIDMDRFVSTMGPSKEERAHNVAADPYAAAKFFHFMIKTILQTLFGISVTPHQVVHGQGVFGTVSAYFGVVESQGRGSLHLHTLLWLKDAPTMDEMEHLLQQNEFRDRVKTFIKANIRAYLPGFDSAEGVKRIPNEVDVAYSRPPVPGCEGYQEQVANFERRVARAKQLHTCESRRCLVAGKNGGLVCKRRAPFALSEDDFITEGGEWGMKRAYAYFNAWVPALTINARCNNDAKLLTNSRATTNLTFYITSYQTKKQGKSHNLSAVLAKGLAYHNERTSYLDDLRNQQRLLLFRLVHTINRDQELAAPMVMSYLMGWGDTYRSHHYTPIYWSSFTTALLSVFPELKQATGRGRGVPPDAIAIAGTVAQSSGDVEDENKGLSTTATGAECSADMVGDGKGTLATTRSDECNGHHEGDTLDVVALTADEDGNIIPKCQVSDYMYRGEALATDNVIDFFVCSYEVQKRVSTNVESRENQPFAPVATTSTTAGKHGGGRPRHERVQYQADHPRSKKKERVMRRLNHHNLPNFIGRYFPPSDDPQQRDFYCASMLLLLKPWRNIATDLKTGTQSWEEAFEAHVSNSSPEIRRILSGIQYYHQCERSTHELESSDTRPRSRAEEDGVDEDGEGAEGPATGTDLPTAVTEEDVADVIASRIPWAEHLHGRLAVEAAQFAGIFPSEDTRTPAPLAHPSLLPTDCADLTLTCGVRRAEQADMEKLLLWKEQMTRDVEQQNQSSDAPLPSPSSLALEGDVRAIEELVTIPLPAKGGGEERAEEALTAVHPSMLNEGQRRAFEIAKRHLDQTLSGCSPPPLRMLLHGEGGTGKSKVIQTITEYFTSRGASHLLLKAAYTGVAASLIDGKTTHTIGMVTQGGGGVLSVQTKAKLQHFWREYEYLIIDEMSMVGKTFLAKLSRNIAVGKTVDGAGGSSLSFGGINVIMCGDFHQFPPVAVGPSEALYVTPNPRKDSTFAQLGRAIYEEFETVVVLTEQMRVSDAVWLDFLKHLRVGRVQETHLAMLRTLVLTNPEVPPPNFTQTPWKEASLVTPRHGVRQQWNDAALRKHARHTATTVFICKAEDTIGGQPLNVEERYAFVSQGSGGVQGGRRRKANLPDAVEVCIGMKVMVTQNVETDLDITNGARGTIVDILLHPDEPTPTEVDGEVHLKHLPVYILVKLNRTRTSQLPGLHTSVIPVEPVIKTSTIRFTTAAGDAVTRRVRRRQYPMTCAYAFTDYRSQGQTISHVVVDIAKPPTGGLNLFNLYVALSRSSGRETIRLLRDFDEKLFLCSHSTDLLAEDDRLQLLDARTRTWWAEITPKL